MSLPHVILGFLHYAPASGYDLKKTFDATVRHFWPADQSQIYRTLTQLSADGLIDVTEVVQTGKPNKKIYSITKTGEKELRTWLRAPDTGGPLRNSALVRVFFLGNLENETILGMLEHAESGLLEEIRRYEAVPAEVDRDAAFPVSKRERFFWMLTLEYGLAMARAEHEWLQSIQRRITKKSYKNVFAPRRKRGGREPGR
ncbi:MAG: PadR family transcriptional regulator [Ignavibacteriae bacterium]|nr:PadR family transcriptional regulator [Ignavibacteriota bacterium]